MDITKLVEKFQKKDVRAFEELYTMYNESMHGVIYSIVKNKEIAEEVLQDVFIKAWNNAESYTSKKGRFFTWLLNIARNAAIDKTRSKQFKENNKNLNSSIFVDILESHDKLDTKLDISYVKKALQKLKDKCISIIELLYFKGYTQKEVSEELEMPIGTVKTNNKKCISELRNLVTKK